MKQTELIIFVIVLVINAGIAIAKKYKERQAAKAAAALARATSPSTSVPATRKASLVRNTPGNAPPKMRATATAARATPAPERSGGAAAIDARGTVRRKIRDSELQAAAARRRQAEARLFEQQVAAEKARITAQQRPTPPVVQRLALEVALARPKATASPAVISSRITANSIGSPRTATPVRAQLLLGDRAGIRRALILREVLGPPRCMAPFGGKPESRQ